MKRSVRNEVHQRNADKDELESTKFHVRRHAWGGQLRLAWEVVRPPARRGLEQLEVDVAALRRDRSVCESAIFQLADAASPTIIRGSEDAGTIYVLMPMRV